MRDYLFKQYSYTILSVENDTLVTNAYSESY